MEKQAKTTEEHGDQQKNSLQIWGTNMQLKTIEGEQVNLNAYDNKEDIQLFLKQKKYLTILLIKEI